MQFTFNEFSKYLQTTYNDVVYRVPIDIGFSCPNRDSYRGSGGCTFCNGSGSKARHLINKNTIKEQVQAGARIARTRYNAKILMAYFQAYTSTYAPIEEIKELFEEVLSQEDFKIITISTRPDCLGEEVLEYLKELSSRYELWVELGVQTIHDSTLKHINRGHDFQTSQDAILKLHELGIKVAVHVVLGLPGETESMMLESARTLGQLPIDGVKIHNLHIIKGTKIEQQYKNGEIKVFDEQEYAEILMQFLRQIPKKLPIMRIIAESSPEELIAPHWWLKKGQFIEYVKKQMTQRNWQQGDLVENKQEILHNENILCQKDKVEDTKEQQILKTLIDHDRNNVLLIASKKEEDITKWFFEKSNQDITITEYANKINTYHTQINRFYNKCSLKLGEITTEVLLRKCQPVIFDFCSPKEEDYDLLMKEDNWHSFVESLHPKSILIIRIRNKRIKQVLQDYGWTLKTHLLESKIITIASK